MPICPVAKTNTVIGIVGLGHMGSRLAKRLHGAGWAVKVWNRNPAPALALAEDGIVFEPRLSVMVGSCTVVLSCLANDEAVDSVYFDESGVFSAVHPATTILEMSTISAELSRKLHDKATSLGVPLLDLAISGSTPAVDAGTITLLAGGDQAAFDAHVPIYEAIAKQWFLIGPASSGIRMKLVVNLLLGVNMEAIAEALLLGESLRIERGVLLNVLSKTTVIAPALMGKFKKISNGDYSSEFPLRLMSKDMDLVMDAAASAGAELPMSEVVRGVLASAAPSSGDLDLSAIVPFVLDGARV